MNNLIKNLVFNIYTFFSTSFENFLFKKQVVNNQLLQYGYMKYNFVNNLLLKQYIEKKIKGSNNYICKYEIKKNKIAELIYLIFIKNNLSKHISNLTGFNYCIDFFVAYETKHIPETEKQNQIYANHWHRDKPFSKNTLKLIIPIEEIGEKNGGIEILDKESTLFFKKNIQNLENKNIQFYKMLAKNNEYLLFLPNLCFHRAGTPEDNLTRSQIMFQLNPSKNWCYKKNLYDLQFFLEPKFPLFKLLNKTISIENEK